MNILFVWLGLHQKFTYRIIMRDTNNRILYSNYLNN